MKIGNRTIGEGNPSYIIAEIGINHNGSLPLALLLIDVAVKAGCDAVKFQKRTVNVVYSAQELARARPNLFGPTNGDLKYGLEFNCEEYRAIFDYCRQHTIDCFVSVWDQQSVDFIEQFHPPCYKIPSPALTDADLLRRCKQTGRPIILSTGMSNREQIMRAVELLGYENLALLHCTSTYPCPPEDINLRAIRTLRETFPCPVGYSGHELSLWTTVAAVAIGSAIVERHITLNRRLWGSDQAISIEPDELHTLVQAIRQIEASMGSGAVEILQSELPALQKLRRST